MSRSGMIAESRSGFIQGLTAEEAAEIAKLYIIKDLPKSRYATKPAVMVLGPGEKKLVYSHIEIYKMVEEAAHVLRESGVRPKTVVAMLFDSSVESVVTFLALEWVHAIAAPINPHMAEDGIESAIRNVNAGVVIAQFVDESDRTGGDIYSKATKVSAALKLKLWATRRTINRGVFLETGKNVIGDPAWHGGAGDYTLDMNEDAILTHALDVERLILPLTHRNICTSAKIFTKTYGINSLSVTLWAKPIYDVHGILVLLSSFYSGGMLVIPDGGLFEPEEFWQLVALTNVTWISTDGDMINAIKNATTTRPPTSSLKFIRVAGGTYIDPHEYSDYEATFGVPIMESYGLAECSGLAATNTEFEYKPGTLGPTCDGIDIAIFSTDPENRELLGPNQLGDIAVKGASVTQGYIDNEEENRFGKIITRVEASVEASVDESGTDISEVIEEWFATGDRGELDSDGYLIVYGSGRDFRAEEELARRALRREHDMAVSAASAKAAEEAVRQRELEERERAEAEAVIQMRESQLKAPLREDAMMVVSTLRGTKLTEDDMAEAKYRDEWMTVNKFMGVEHASDKYPITKKDRETKKVFIRRVKETKTVPLPRGYEQKLRRTALLNNKVSFEYFYDDAADQDMIEHVLHTIGDWDETSAAAGDVDEAYQLVAMSEQDMVELRTSAEEEFVRKLREEERRLQTESRIRLLEDRERLEKISNQEISAAAAIYQRNLERQLDESKIKYDEHYKVLLEQEKQRQAETYLLEVERQRKISEDEFALALAYLELRKTDETKRNLMLAEREISNSVLIEWEKENFDKQDLELVDRAMALDHQTVRARSIEEENVQWKTKMREHFDDTLSAMLTMYENRLIKDEKCYVLIRDQVNAMVRKQQLLEEELGVVYAREQQETEAMLAALKVRRVEVEREATKLRNEIYRVAQTPHLMEVDLEMMESLVLESARAADAAAVLSQETAEMQTRAANALESAQDAASSATATAASACEHAARAEAVRDAASLRPPEPIETYYRSAQLYEPDDDPDIVKREILVDLDEVDATMELHPAVERCISYSIDDPKNGMEVMCNVQLQHGARCSEEWLKLFAQTKLPAAMVPVAFRRVISMPALVTHDQAPQMQTTHVDFIPARQRVIRAPTWRPVVGGTSEKVRAY